MSDICYIDNLLRILIAGVIVTASIIDYRGVFIWCSTSFFSNHPYSRVSLVVVPFLGLTLSAAVAGYEGFTILGAVTSLAFGTFGRGFGIYFSYFRGTKTFLGCTGLTTFLKNGVSSYNLGLNGVLIFSFKFCFLKFA